MNPLKKESGDDGAVDTPVPIPNTEVKHRCGEGSLGKNSKLPGSFFCGEFGFIYVAFFFLKPLLLAKI